MSAVMAIHVGTGAEVELEIVGMGRRLWAVDSKGVRLSFLLPTGVCCERMLLRLVLDGPTLAMIRGAPTAYAEEPERRLPAERGFAPRTATPDAKPTQAGFSWNA